jgi:hypothetical protein
MFVLTWRHTPLAHSALSAQRRFAAVPEAPEVGRQCIAVTVLVPVTTADTVHRRPPPQLASVQHTSAQAPLSQRPLRHASGPEQASPTAFVPSAAMPSARALTQ